MRVRTKIAEGHYNVTAARSNGGNHIGFAQNPRRLNVAISRAQKSLTIVGNANVFERLDLHKWSKNSAEAIETQLDAGGGSLPPVWLFVGRLHHSGPLAPAVCAQPSWRDGSSSWPVEVHSHRRLHWRPFQRVEFGVCLVSFRCCSICTTLRRGQGQGSRKGEGRQRSQGQRQTVQWTHGIHQPLTVSMKWSQVASLPSLPKLLAAGPSDGVRKDFRHVFRDMKSRASCTKLAGKQHRAASMCCFHMAQMLRKPWAHRHYEYTSSTLLRGRVMPVQGSTQGWGKDMSTGLTTALDDVRPCFFIFFPIVRMTQPAATSPLWDWGMRQKHQIDPDRQGRALTRAAWSTNHTTSLQGSVVLCLVTPEHPSSDSGSQRSKTVACHGRVLQIVERAIAAPYIWCSKSLKNMIYCPSWSIFLLLQCTDAGKIW